MTQISQSCPNCGGDLKAVSGELLHCPYCESDFESRSFRRRFDKLHKGLDQTKIEYVNTKRRNLYDAVSAKYISKNEVCQYATEIKKLLPNDFQANFYLEAISGDSQKINSLIRKINVKENYELLQPVIYFLVASLQGEFLLELNLLIERAYKTRDLSLYCRYTTKLSETSENIFIEENCTAPSIPSGTPAPVPKKSIVVEENCAIPSSTPAQVYKPNNRKTVKEAPENKSGSKVTKYTVDGEQVANEWIPKQQVSKNSKPSAQEINDLGEKYYFGKDGFTQDYKKAFEFFTQSASQGNAAAQYNLGYCYRNGNGVYQSDKKAAEWLKKAAAQGHATAQYELGICYRDGKGVPQSEEKAVEWFEKAAKQGHAKATKALEGLRQKMQDAAPPVLKSANPMPISNLQKRDHVPTSIKRKQEVSPVTTPTPKEAAETYETKKASEGLAYRVNPDRKSCTVFGAGTCQDKDIVIPREIDGYQVTGIVVKTKYVSRHGFESGFDKDITSVVIPDSVASIGAGTFYGCTSLASVEIPNSVTSIGEWAFYGCKNLASVKIPNFVAMIEEGTFQDCVSLTSAVIPNSVTWIYSGAFDGCANLSSIRYGGSKELWNRITDDRLAIPSSVKIQYDMLNPAWSIDLAYKVDIFDKFCSIIGQGSCKDKNIVIPKIIDSYRVTSIGYRAFYDCENLASVVIPDSVTSIEDGAFSWCRNLTNVVIPDSVTSIEDRAFSWCRNLTSAVIPDSVTSIGDSAFYYCEKLSSLRYNGKKNQWKTISLGSDWKKNTSIRKIECTDGDINL